jgi:hypothetical protein
MQPRRKPASAKSKADFLMEKNRLTVGNVLEKKDLVFDSRYFRTLSGQMTAKALFSTPGRTEVMYRFAQVFAGLAGQPLKFLFHSTFLRVCSAANSHPKLKIELETIDPRSFIRNPSLEKTLAYFDPTVLARLVGYVV